MKNNKHLIKNESNEAKKRGVHNREFFYVKNAKYAKKALKTVARLMDSNNESVALGAAKLILSKVIPDLKAKDITTDGQQVRIVIHESLKQTQ